MKVLSFLLFLVILFSNNISFAQDKPKAAAITATENCSDVLVHSRLVEANQELEAKGYKLVSFSSENLKSNIFKYVRLECKAGEEYEIRYVLGKKTKRYQLYVLAEQSEYFVQSKQKLETGSINLIKERFRATKDGVYVLFYAQKARGSNCVGLSVFKK